MAEAKGQMAAAAPAPQPPTDIENLPALFGRLGDEVIKLLDTKLSLVKVEIRDEVAAYARSGALFSAGAAIAAIGFALLNVAVAFFVSLLFSFQQPLNYALGFVITGAVYLVIGSVLVMVMRNRLAARSPMPSRSIEELRKDKQWLKNET
jgi:uncharacterized membrane protein YqjE